MRGHRTGWSSSVTLFVGIDVARSIEGSFLPWLQQTLDLMLPYLPPPPVDFVPSPRTYLPPPIYRLEPVCEPKIDCLSLSPSTNGYSLPLEPLAVLSNGHSGANGHVLGQSAPTRSTDPGGNESKPSDWVWASMTENRRVTPEEWWQNVREIELEFEDRSM